MSSLRWFYLGKNQLNGTLTDTIGQLSNLEDLNVSFNSLQGSSLCAIAGGILANIELSNNLLSGGLPDCWIRFQKLVILNLANNNLSGKIPFSIGSLRQIQTLGLRKNNFFGEFPLSLKNCTQLKILDLGENKLSDKIPAWIGDSLSWLIVLSLRSNEFHGSIPRNLCHLTYIQILDLSNNNISGTIPQCLNNFTAMSQKGNSNAVISYKYPYIQIRVGNGWIFYNALYVDNALVILKGLVLEYGRNLALVKSIDLSNNKLIGEIPKEIMSLIELCALNLSRNNLIGQIPPMIGQLKMLGSLDLSRNRLFGAVPASLSDLNLSKLDLSNNYLLGRIPTGTQLQSFDSSAYMGNLDLCGSPLPNKCLGDGTAQYSPALVAVKTPTLIKNEDGFITPGFYVSMELGFTLGFCGACGTLLLNSSCRHAYFHFLNDVKDWLYVILAVNIGRLQRRLRG
ncbi:hypothetical protein L1049_014146 [Liquidambar formosana]|uniref:Uncharacterized protein n=1 Tax=Liquidambar formosana TaxID=63359 RepID=A0AAP0RLS6_LIQFO